MLDFQTNSWRCELRFEYVADVVYIYITGVDLNRNYDFHWGESGVSRDPCSDSYLGESPASEPEIRNLERFMSQELSGRLQFFMDLHAYGRLWLIPWSYDNKATLADRKAQVSKICIKLLLLSVASALCYLRIRTTQHMHTHIQNNSDTLGSVGERKLGSELDKHPN